MSRICIVGGGVIGLTTALEIQKEIKNVNVTIITEKLSPNTTADVSAGLWSPYLLEHTPFESVIKWSKFTFEYALDLWKRGKCNETGISLIPSINVTAENDVKIPEWSKITLGFHELDERQLKELSEKHKQNYKRGFSFLTAIIEPTKLLPILKGEFLKNGGNIIMEKIERLYELRDYDVIVNCTGISSCKLINDNKVYPIRGQIARVRAPWQFHVLNIDDHYIIPNSDCVILGGTHQNSYDLTISDTDKNIILNSCQNIVPSLINADIVKDQVGLRPGRDMVRIELEILNVDGKLMKIVHNYGHGGSGVTLCIGCAKQACDLVKDALKLINKL